MLERLKVFIDKRLPFIGWTYRNIRDNRKFYQEPKNTSLGFKFNGNNAMERGEFEPIETLTVKRILNQVETVINVGSNIGYYVCIAAAQKKHVLAFEPFSQNLKYLYRNISANNWKENIEIFPIAISDEVGLVNIFGSGTGASLIEGWSGISSAYKSLVPTSTLNNVIGNRYSNERLLIIIDIEGSELKALNGASNLLERSIKPIWMVEISSNDHQPESNTINPNLYETFKVFFDNGYSAKTVEKFPRPVLLDEISSICSSGVSTLSSHNFIFYDPELGL